jgi:hypothetical protein
MSRSAGQVSTNTNRRNAYAALNRDARAALARFGGARLDVAFNGQSWSVRVMPDKHTSTFHGAVARSFAKGSQASVTLDQLHARADEWAAAPLALGVGRELDLAMAALAAQPHPLTRAIADTAHAG